MQAQNLQKTAKVCYGDFRVWLLAAGKNKLVRWKQKMTLL